MGLLLQYQAETQHSNSRKTFFILK